MAEPGGWMRQIDKVSYGVAALLGGVLLAIPFLFSRGVPELAQAVEARTARLEELYGEKASDLENPSGPDVIVREWRPVAPLAPAARPSWPHEIAPALVRAYPRPEDLKAGHPPAAMVAIECARDAEKRKPYLKVRAQLPPAAEYEKNHVSLAAVHLERRAGLDGKPEPVKGFSYPGSGESVEHDDYDVKPGEVYSYRITTVVKATEHATVDSDWQDGQHRLVSDWLGPTREVPYDMSVQISRFDESDLLNPRVYARVDYWDYEKGGAVVARTTQAYKEGDQVAGGRFTVRWIRPGQDLVSLRGKEIRSLEIKRTGGERREVDCWPEPLRAKSAEPEPAPPEKTATRPSRPAGPAARAAGGSPARGPKEPVKGKKPAGRKLRFGD